MNLKSFRYKMFLYIGVSIGALLFLLGCFAFYYVNSSLTEDTIYANQELTNSSSTNIDNLLSEMNKLALYSSTNPEVRETMTILYNTTDSSNALIQYNYAVIDILTSITVPNSASNYRISILNRENFFETTGVPTSIAYLNTFLYSDEFYEWYDAIPIINNNESIAYEMYDPLISENTDEYVTTYREIFSDTTSAYTVGIVMVQCPIDDFIEIIDYEDTAIEAYIFDEDGNLLIFNGSDSDNNFVSELSTNELSELLASESNFSYNYTYSVSTLSNDWQLLVVQTQNVFTSVLLPIIVYLICGTLVLLLLTLFVLSFIVKRTTQPLQQLIQQVDEVSLSNLSINTHETTFDEFELLNNAFSDMFTRLRSSMEENEKRKTYELQANLIALQSQMDPHFLYNILAVIKSMNREQNYEQVDYCCNYLARMLRYISTYDENTVTIHQELEQAELYLNLMKFRYEDQFNFYINVEPDMNTDAISINKQVLQPLLENCFQHGFKNVLPVWNIIINCYTLDAYWYISVSDNGGGITPEQIQSIHNSVTTFTENPSNSISQLTLGGMGLVNTLSRLKLNQTSNVSFTITHNYPTGTIITIKGDLADEYICN